MVAAMPRRTLAAAVLLVAVASCSTPAEPTQQPATEADQPFIRQVRQRTTIQNSDGELVTLADRACSNLNTSGQLTSAVTALRDAVGWTLEDAAAFTGLSIRFYCPELANLAT